MKQSGNQPAWTTVAEFQLSYKTMVKPSDRPVVNASAEAYHLLLGIWNRDIIELQEHFKVLFLNCSNKVIGMYQCSEGGVTGTVADPRIILAATLLSGACSIILAHNHPGGSTRPSAADLALTQKIRRAAEYIDVKVVDHLIITTEGYYSFADEGVL